MHPHPGPDCVCGEKGGYPTRKKGEKKVDPGTEETIQSELFQQGPGQASTRKLTLENFVQLALKKDT